MRCGWAGNMPPIVTGPVVIQAKVSSRVSVQIVAQDPNNDPITYSLLSPWPVGASIGEGEKILNVQPNVPAFPLSTTTGSHSKGTLGS